MDDFDSRREMRAESRQARREERRQRRGFYPGSLFWPLIFIAVGVVLLLRNSGALTGNAWDLTLRLWPVVIIAGGLDGLYRRDGIVGPVFWTGMGVLLLLSSLGVVVWNVWDIILRLWPLLFVALGLDLLSRRRPIWLSLAALLVMVAIVAAALWYMAPGVQAQVLPAQDFSQSLGSAKQASISLNPSAGTLNVNSLGGSSNDQLLEGKVQKARTETIQPDVSQNGDRVSYSLSSQGLAMFYPTSAAQNWTWNVDLNPGVPIALRADMGAGNMLIDLRNLQISSLDAGIGLGKITVYLPASGHFSGTINGAIGEVEVVIPKGMDVRVKANNAITAVEAPEAYQHSDSIYTSPGYASAENRISLDISQAIGKVTLRAEP